MCSVQMCRGEIGLSRQATWLSLFCFVLFLEVNSNIIRVNATNLNWCGLNLGSLIYNYNFRILCIRMKCQIVYSFIPASSRPEGYKDSTCLKEAHSVVLKILVLNIWQNHSVESSLTIISCWQPQQIIPALHDLFAHSFQILWVSTMCQILY